MNSKKLSILYAVLCMVGVVLIGFPTVGFAAALFSLSFVGGLVLWLATTYRTPVDPSKIIVPYLLTVIFFIIEVYEEYLTNMEVVMTQMSGHQVLESDFLIVTAFVAPIVWLTGAVALMKRWHFGYFLISAFLFDMMFANLSHFAFPFLIDGTFHYVSGLYTAILPVITAWYTFTIILREIRNIKEQHRTGTAKQRIPEVIMKLKQQIRAHFLRFLKHYFNPLTRRIAHSSFGPFALVRHVGRRSGRQYETPIIVQPVADGFVFELTYGPEVDLYKNVVAAGRFALCWHGKEYVIDQIEPLDTAVGMSAFPLPARLLLRAIKRQHFAKMIVEDTI